MEQVSGHQVSVSYQFPPSDWLFSNCPLPFQLRKVFQVLLFFNPTTLSLRSYFFVVVIDPDQTLDGLIRRSDV